MSEMQGFDLPNTKGVEPAEAAEMLNKIMADGMYREGHPYMNANHPQHSDFVNRVNQLNAIKFRDATEEPDIESGFQEQYDKMLRERISEAKGVMAQLGAEGFQVENIPDDLADCELAGLRIQLDLARHNFSDAASFLQSKLIHLPQQPKEIYEAWQRFKNPAIDDVDSRERNGDIVLRYVVSQLRAREGCPRGGE